MTDDDEAGVDAWAALLRCHAAVVPVISTEVVRATGLPLSWYDVLLELRAAPDGRLRMQELGGRVVLSRSRVSRLVDDMAAAGLVAREADPHDRRGAFTRITRRGEREFRKAVPAYMDAIRRHFAGHLRADEQAAVAAALSRVADAEERVVR